MKCNIDVDIVAEILSELERVGESLNAVASGVDSITDPLPIAVGVAIVVDEVFIE